MRIQCPECSQRFDVTDDFLGKTVECGSCDGRFKVSAESIVKDKTKFYPGEKRETHLERFGRNSTDGTAPVDFKQAHYQPDVNAARIGPPRPRQTVATIVGISLMSLIIVVFLLAGGKEGVMRDMETMNRFVLAGFTALLGGLLVMYGMANNRRLGLVLTAVFGVILLLLPVLFPANPMNASVDPIVVGGNVNSDQGTSVLSNDKGRDDYLFEIGYGPVKEALVKSPENEVVGIYLRNASELVSGKIRDYLYEATGKANRGIIYERGEKGSDGLILFLQQKRSIDEMAALCEKFGRIEKIEKKLRLIDVIVERSKIDQLDKYKMLDSSSLDFEFQNLQALKSIDPTERLNAVKRLAGAEPRSRRDDITQQFIKMIPESSIELQLELINALKTWALPTAGAEPVVLEAVKKIHAQGKADKASMEFLIGRKVEGSELILVDLWEGNPAAWSEMMLQLGQDAQILLTPKLKDMDVPHLVSACEIIAKTGTAESIPLLEKLMEEKEGQSENSLQAAIDEIKKRQ